MLEDIPKLDNRLYTKIANEEITQRRRAGHPPEEPFVNHEGFYVLPARGRVTIVHPEDDHLVIKRDFNRDPERLLGNFIECLVYYYLYYRRAEHLEYVAPIIEHTDDFKNITMQRATRVSTTKPPYDLPSWMSDLRKENVGYIGNRQVCIDYGDFRNLVNLGIGRYRSESECFNKTVAEKLFGRKF